MCDVVKFFYRRWILLLFHRNQEAESKGLYEMRILLVVVIPMITGFILVMVSPWLLITFALGLLYGQLLNELYHTPRKTKINIYRRNDSSKLEFSPEAISAMRKADENVARR